jgi:arginyl-tRNA synthetase
VITAGLRRAILDAAGLPGADPLLRPGPAPGSYASSLPFRLARSGRDPREVAAALAAELAREPWIAAAEVTGRGFLTVTVTHDALAGLAVRIARTGPACAESDALRGRTVPAPTPEPPGPPVGAPGWAQARAALAGQLTARLAAAAGATLIFDPERSGFPAPASLPPPLPGTGPVADAAGYAGADAVRFTLARMPPGSPVSRSTASRSTVSRSTVSRSTASASPASASPASASPASASPAPASAAPQAAVIARHVLANPAYAVRYAHAAAAAVLRWAAALGTRPAGFTPRLLAEPGELALLDALSWLPDRVAVAARRGRPDEFAGYLEELAARTIDTMSTTSFRTTSRISSERLWLADAARTGLAAGLGLLGIGAPSRL